MVRGGSELDDGSGTKRSLQEIIADDDAYLRLLERYGGQRIEVPSSGPTYRGVFYAVLGPDAFGRFQASLAGATIKVPVDRSFRVLRLRQNGLSVPDITRRLCLSENCVRQILAYSRRTEARRTRLKMLAIKATPCRQGAAP